MGFVTKVKEIKRYIENQTPPLAENNIDVPI